MIRNRRRSLEIFGKKSSLSGPMQQFSNVLAEVPYNFARSVRDELLEWASKEIPIRTARNIKQGYRESKYPAPADTARTPAGRLAKTVRAVYQPGKDTLMVRYGGNLPYAGLHNEPRGSYNEVHGGGKLMVFPNRRGRNGRGTKKQAFTRARVVMKPGKAVFDEAVQSVVNDTPEKMAQIVRRNQNNLFRNNKYRMTDQGIKVRIRRKRKL